MLDQDGSGPRDALRRAGFRVVIRETIGTHGMKRHELSGRGPLGAIFVSATSEAEAWRLALEHARQHMAIGQPET